MATRFLEVETLRLAEIYRDNECLWNIRSSLYNNRDAREKAYRDIWKRLNVPGLSIKDIPIKIKNLRTSYHQELKKIEISTRSGFGPEMAYRPSVPWFATVDSFLSGFRGSTKNTVYYGAGEAQSNASDDAADNDPTFVDDMFVEEKYNPADALKPLESSCSMSADCSDQNEIQEYQERCTRGVTSRNKEEISEAIERIDKIADQMTRNIHSVQSPGDDECDSFGKYIAAALRALPPEMAIAARTELQKTLSHIQLRSIRQS